MYCNKCGNEITDSEATFCPSCNEKLPGQGEGKNEAQPKKLKKVVLGLLGGLLLLVLVVIASMTIYRGTPNYQLKNSYYMDAIDVYFEHFQNTDKEISAIDYLVSAIDEPFSGYSGYPYFFRSYGTDVINHSTYTDDFDKLQKFFQIAHEKAPSEITEKWNTYFLEIERIADIATPLKDIYANPKLYVGKTVIVAGYSDSNNDIKRGMLKIGEDVGYTGYVASEYYPLELSYKYTLGNTVVYLDQKWEDAAGNYAVIAYGMLKKYSNSDGIYLAVVQMDYLNEADLSTYYIGR